MNKKFMKKLVSNKINWQFLQANYIIHALGLYLVQEYLFKHAFHLCVAEVHC